MGDPATQEARAEKDHGAKQGAVRGDRPSQGLEDDRESIKMLVAYYKEGKATPPTPDRRA